MNSPRSGGANRTRRTRRNSPSTNGRLQGCYRISTNPIRPGGPCAMAGARSTQSRLSLPPVGEQVCRAGDNHEDGMGTLSSAGKRIRGRKHGVIRQRRMARSKWLCEHCLASGRVRIATVVNHKIPLAHGGEDIDENTENLCAECDEIVTAEQFGRKVKQAIGEDGWPLDR